ncbi:hypothetical protein KIPB_010925, partial [Kipferlia bialata]
INKSELAKYKTAIAQLVEIKVPQITAGNYSTRFARSLGVPLWVGKAAEELANAARSCGATQGVFPQTVGGAALLCVCSVLPTLDLSVPNARLGRDLSSAVSACQSVGATEIGETSTMRPSTIRNALGMIEGASDKMGTDATKALVSSWGKKLG